MKHLSVFIVGASPLESVFMLEHLSVGASISIHDRELVGASMVGAMQKLAIVCYSRMLVFLSSSTKQEMLHIF